MDNKRNPCKIVVYIKTNLVPIFLSLSPRPKSFSIACLVSHYNQRKPIWLYGEHNSMHKRHRGHTSRRMFSDTLYCSTNASLEINNSKTAATYPNTFFPLARFPFCDTSTLTESRLLTTSCILHLHSQQTKFSDRVIFNFIGYQFP